ncbi:MAG: hypothetical protein LiPW30_559 [Parcubacteria group bacterium LiPW_30]|nr:MAG: hypothetical protein LiPW30_559 [Parcubacteria group bacterium LiPW_30]
MKKLLVKDSDENVIVDVIFRADDNNEYECVGVLVEENDNLIEVAFNSKNGEIVDSINIKRADIISINVLDSSKIEKLT